MRSWRRAAGGVSAAVLAVVGVLGVLAGGVGIARVWAEPRGMGAGTVSSATRTTTTTATSTSTTTSTSTNGRTTGGTQAAWVQTGSDDGIASFKREVPGSDVIALRGEGIVAAPIVRVVSVLLDYTRATEWIDSLNEVRIVRMLGPLEFIEYDRVGTPPIIMKDRDFVCRGKLTLDVKEQSLVMTIEPATDPAVPVTSRYVRGTLRGYWKLKAIDGGRKTSVIAEMHGDPRGGVAKWLVNLFQKGWARNTIESLREQVAKRDIKIMPAVKAAFAGQPLEIAIKSK